jgi:protein transport protein SEC13
MATMVAPQASVPNASIDTAHEDMIHDVQLDYYGKRLATASSDRMIKIFDVSPDQTQHQLSASIQAHEGPVWQVAWAHPKFGSILASCSYDRKVCVWKETQPQQWTKVYEYADHQSSVNSIAFAPHDLGLKLAAASADGSISILSWRGPQDNAWEEKQIHNAHQIGCNAVSWAPAAAPGSATGSGGTQATLVTGGCDGLVKVWDLPENGEAVLDSEFEMAYKDAAHSGWVRDVAWAPGIGLSVRTLASCGEDKMVHVYSQAAGGAWACTKLPPFEAVVWRVSWSLTGNVLAVSCGDGKVTLWKEGLDGQWRLIESIHDQ